MEYNFFYILFMKTFLFEMIFLIARKKEEEEEEEEEKEIFFDVFICLMDWYRHCMIVCP